MSTLSAGGLPPPRPLAMSVGGLRPPTHPKESAFGLHAPHTKANREAILFLSAKDMIYQPGSDILTSCPTYDESACPIYDEKKQVSENKTRLGIQSVGLTVGRSGAGVRSVGRSAGRAVRRSGGRTVGRAVGQKCVHFFRRACKIQP